MNERALTLYFMVAGGCWLITCIINAANYADSQKPGDKKKRAKWFVWWVKWGLFICIAAPILGLIVVVRWVRQIFREARDE